MIRSRNKRKVLLIVISTIFAIIAVAVIISTAGVSVTQLYNPAEASPIVSVAELDKLYFDNQEKLDKEKIREAELKLAEEQKKAEADADEKFSELQKQIKDYLDQQDGVYGFMLYTEAKVGDLSLVKTIGSNQDTVFRMASTYKVPAMLYLYEQVAAGNLGLDEMLVYEPEYFTEGTGSLQYQPTGGLYSVRELASLTIRESDNVALNMLVDRIGEQNVLMFMESLGSKVSYDNTFWDTPRDLVMFMREVEKFDVKNPSEGNMLLYDMENTVFEDRIRAGTPSGVVVAHKIGNLDATVNDVAIVYATKGKYILAIMAENVPDDQAAANVETEVAKMVFDAIGT